MAVAQDQYASEYGWIIVPPAGWEPLPPSDGPSLSMHRPVVFSCDHNSDLSMTWMVAGHPMKEEVAKRFLSAVEAPDITMTDLLEIAPTVFPLIGKVDSCELVLLADGSRALEVIESYHEEGSDEEKNGYQLILPLKDVSNYPRMFQRLCFYAAERDFKEYLPRVREAARSFRYVRPYGYLTKTPPE